LAQAGLVFAYPQVGWILTGFLVGGGADVWHLLKNKTDPKVKA
jgi:hypothetical protein